MAIAKQNNEQKLGKMEGEKEYCPKQTKGRASEK